MTEAEILMMVAQPHALLNVEMGLQQELKNVTTEVMWLTMVAHLPVPSSVEMDR